MRIVSKQVRLGLVFIIMVMDIIGASLFYPIAPFIVRQYSNDAMMVTMLTVLYSAAQFVAAPILGKLSDRWGRRPVLLASVAGSAVAYAVFGLSSALWMIFLSRVVGGLSGGSLSTAGAYIADISLPHERSRNFTLIGISWGVGLIAGPALGTALAQLSLTAPAWFATGLMLVSLVLCVFFLPESLPSDARESGPMRPAALNPLRSIGRMLRKETVGRLLIVSCLYNLAVNGTNSINTLFMIDRFAAASWLVGAYLVAIGAGVAALQLAIPPIVRRLGERKTVALTLSQQAAGGVAIFFSGSLAYYLPVSLLNAWCGNFIYAPLTALETNRIGDGEIGMLMGVTTALNSLMNIFGPLWAGYVYDAVSPGAPFAAASALFLAAVFALPGNGVMPLLRKALARLIKAPPAGGRTAQ